MKKLLTILVLIMLIISFFQISSMYALYKEQIQDEYNTLLGAWEIKVNETDVTTSGQVETFTISDSQLGYLDSEYIQAGKIAPNGNAYFDIVIDPSDTDVSVIYGIDIDKNVKSSTNTNIELKDAIYFWYAENYFGKLDENGQMIQIENGTRYYGYGGHMYTSVIPIEKINEGYKNYVRLYFYWENRTDNDELDSILGTTQIETEVEGENVIKGANISIPIQINFKQYTGENLYDGE